MAQAGQEGPPRALMIAAIAVGIVAIAAVLAIAVIRQTPPQEQVPIATVPAPRANSTECQALLAGLPEDFGDFHRVPAAEPAPAGAAAWQAASDAEPVILRCGLDRPAEFVVGVPIQVVDAVQWFEIRDSGRSIWFSVDRPVYVALTLPQGSGPMPIQQISETIAKTLPATEIDPAPAR